MKVQDAEFHDVVDDLVMQLEDDLEEYPEDLDIENSGGILNIQFPNGTTIVVSRQIANHEVWVAAKSGGFHLALLEDTWFCNTTQETLSQLISRVVSEQLERDVELKLD